MSDLGTFAAGPLLEASEKMDSTLDVFLKIEITMMQLKSQ
jgi:hypothetical protein